MKEIERGSVCNEMENASADACVYLSKKDEKQYYYASVRLRGRGGGGGGVRGYVCV